MQKENAYTISNITHRIALELLHGLRSTHVFTRLNHQQMVSSNLSLIITSCVSVQSRYKQAGSDSTGLKDNLCLGLREGATPKVSSAGLTVALPYDAARTMMSPVPVSAISLIPFHKNSSL